MILVTGASGHFGKTVIDHLLKTMPANEVVAYVRDEKKATALTAQGVQLRIGSYDEVAAIEKAVQGIDKILLVSGLDMHRFEQHARIITAARQAGVQQVIYTSAALNDFPTTANKLLMESHFQTEDFLKQSGLAYTLLRNSLYTEVIPGFVGDRVLETGIFYPAGDGKTSFASRNDMAEAAARVLLGTGHEQQTYHITGATAYSFGDIAQALSELSGKAVTYQNIDPATFESHLQQAGVPEIGVQITAGFAADIRAGQFSVVSPDLEKLLGRKPATLKEGLKAVYKL
ncbi:NAD(P)H dehydrogenase (quinone) [Chitinophaga costaii]|uniref:NAD(P)H dehydrogenase (Quinone) n=1 Tax=Chitinophaga costaii TaxID=1335309 RepID=A0A1C4FKD9_9BACT|nr:SDR family oxidoreductase [Chitinophaga costaii]PUZ29992.1 SDR family NAD(P)-dependent oxidoreductase [Chitinophaga costaii]SCC56410.1 NAD(P)H dehydrogenase (quinone) [Chitinophaga costaii]